MQMILRAVNILEKFRNMEIQSVFLFGVVCVLALFGVLNVFLGYRLIRVWMMLGGLAGGGIIGFLISRILEVGQQERTLFIVVGVGILFGALSFFVYRAGIFAVGALIGLLLSIYLIHPTTSATFFICILTGLGLGSLTLKFSRELLIISTSIMGGLLAGLSAAKLAGLQEFPYGWGISLALAVIGMWIQFLTNRASEPEEETPDEETLSEGEAESGYDSIDYDEEEDDLWPRK